jgi:acyl carrier protein
MATTSPIEPIVRQYILEEFLQGEDPSQLDDTTPLITSGIMDSIRTLKLVAFLEARFSIALAAHEADADHLDTIAMIAALVRSKQ